MSTVGFIGLGNMGSPMAANLARGKVDLIVSDANVALADDFAAEHGVRAGLAESLSEVSTLILMLPSSEVVESVLLADGLANELVPGTLVIDMSSSEPNRSRTLGGTLAASDLRYVDAPVSGGVKGAREATLAIIAGGANQDVDDARPLFALMGRRVFHVGPAGTGHAAKSLNNMVSAVTIAATSEALIAGEQFGIDPHQLNEVFNASSSRSNTTENKVEQFMLSGTYDSGFAMSLMAKDLHISDKLARELNLTLPVSGANLALWSEAHHAMPPRSDQTALYQYLKSTNSQVDHTTSEETQ
ncbi:NAD(P)-dependent oxidoreductase [Rhodococcus fascians]|nr:NAD(P)-dependent oxidoreductase [Rhodococcus fascians]